MTAVTDQRLNTQRFSALQRAEIAEISSHTRGRCRPTRGFSALQRAEIAETAHLQAKQSAANVSVLFNEPKLLKSPLTTIQPQSRRSFSALQRAEIAEMDAQRTVQFVIESVSVLFNEPKLLKSGASRHSV